MHGLSSCYMLKPYASRPTGNRATKSIPGATSARSGSSGLFDSTKGDTAKRHPCSWPGEWTPRYCAPFGATHSKGRFELTWLLRPLDRRNPLLVDSDVSAAGGNEPSIAVVYGWLFCA